MLPLITGAMFTTAWPPLSHHDTTHARNIGRGLSAAGWRYETPNKTPVVPADKRGRRDDYDGNGLRLVCPAADLERHRQRPSRTLCRATHERSGAWHSGRGLPTEGDGRLANSAWLSAARHATPQTHKRPCGSDRMPR